MPNPASGMRFGKGNLLRRQSPILRYLRAKSLAHHMCIAFGPTRLWVDEVLVSELFARSAVDQEEDFFSFPFQFRMVQVQYPDHLVGCRVTVCVRQYSTSQGESESVGAGGILGFGMSCLIKPVPFGGTTIVGWLTLMGFLATTQEEVGETGPQMGMCALRTIMFDVKSCTWTGAIQLSTAIYA